MTSVESVTVTLSMGYETELSQLVQLPSSLWAVQISTSFRSRTEIFAWSVSWCFSLAYPSKEYDSAGV